MIDNNNLQESELPKDDTNINNQSNNNLISDKIISTEDPNSKVNVVNSKILNIIACTKCQKIPNINLSTTKINLNCSCKNKEEYNINDYVKMLEDDSQNICFNPEHQSSKAENYCIECAKYLCNECISFHNKLHGKSHHLTKNKIKCDLMCEKHQSKYINFCLNCKKEICLVCSNDYMHKKHNKIKIDDILTDKKFNEIREKLMKVKKSNYENDKNVVIEKINQIIENKIKEKEISNNVIKEKIERLNKEIESLNNNLKENEEFINNMQNKLQNISENIGKSYNDYLSTNNRTSDIIDNLLYTYNLIKYIPNFNIRNNVLINASIINDLQSQSFINYLENDKSTILMLKDFIELDYNIDLHKDINTLNSELPTSNNNKGNEKLLATNMKSMKSNNNSMNNSVSDIKEANKSNRSNNSLLKNINSIPEDKNEKEESSGIKKLFNKCKDYILNSNNHLDYICTFSSDPNKLQFNTNLTSNSTNFGMVNEFAVYHSSKNEYNLAYVIKGQNPSSYDMVIFSLTEKKIIKTINNIHSNSVFTLKHYYDHIRKRDIIITSSSDGTIKLWDLNDNYKNISYINIKENNNYYYTANILYLNDEMHILGTKLNYGASLFDINGNIIHKYKYNFKIYFSEVYYEDGQVYIVISAGKGNIDVYNYDKIYKQFTQVGNSFCVNFIKTENATYLIGTSNGNNKIYFWDLHKGDLAKEICINNGDPINGICVWNEKFLLVGCDTNIVLIDIIQGKDVQEIKGHNNIVKGIKKLVLPEIGECLISQDYNKKSEIKLWTIGN